MAMASTTFLLLLLLKLCKFKVTDVHINCLFLMTSTALKDVSKDYRLLRSRFSKVFNFLAKLVLTTFSSRLRPELVTDNFKQPSGLKKMEVCAILPDLVIYIVVFKPQKSLKVTVIMP